MFPVTRMQNCGKSSCFIIPLCPASPCSTQFAVFKAICWSSCFQHARRVVQDHAAPPGVLLPFGARSLRTRESTPCSSSSLQEDPCWGQISSGEDSVLGMCEFVTQRPSVFINTTFDRSSSEALLFLWCQTVLFSVLGS